ncbi:glycoside hydrolase family 26 protein [Corynebacterium bovis]|uniref:Beta-mannanase n=1 Tax=Corynebacterium bovis DSM 20582 = CIP 54.80 TaxID=927655 RepID=A0A8H9Y7M6_9CORY|nr:glycosyl hydrolase [Corynebacterium bovis]MBB3116058.1 beta-mannanase [Corynebacterium bovis DSM 20582 = CIP 54.80]QQC46996.1 hypothetical protein I6I09_07890 [Corynebacterium bovis]WJY76644.1 Endoglucanase H precursor [Corynebacterium bovis DSM 20582 = CIP 54.80]
MTRLPRLRRLLQRDGRRRRARTATPVTLATASLAATVTAGTASAAEPSQMLVGMFDGTGHTAADTRAVSGTTPATALLFSNFSDQSINDVPSALSRAWNDGSVPVLTLEFDTDGNPNAGARGGGGGAQRDSAAVDTAIAHGRMDARIDRVARSVSRFVAGDDGRPGTADDRKVYIRPGHEMNGDWYRWSATSRQSPADYVDAYRHIHGRFDAAGLTSRNAVQYIWSPMACGNQGLCSSGGNPADYYPGGDVVDWVGVDAYNWGNTRSRSTWESPETILRRSLDQVADIAPGKPLSIPETGTPSDAGGDKNQWFNDLYGFTSYYRHGSDGRGVKMMNYFNVAKNEGSRWIDWTAVRSSDDHRFPAFASMMRRGNVVGGDTARHVSTAAFRGR